MAGVGAADCLSRENGPYGANCASDRILGKPVAQPRLPGTWPVRADLVELTGWVVQVRYLGHLPEPSAADAVCVVDKVIAGEMWCWEFRLTTRNTCCWHQ